MWRRRGWWRDTAHVCGCAGQGGRGDQRSWSCGRVRETRSRKRTRSRKTGCRRRARRKRGTHDGWCFRFHVSERVAEFHDARTGVVHASLWHTHTPNTHSTRTKARAGLAGWCAKESRGSSSPLKPWPSREGTPQNAKTQQAFLSPWLRPGLPFSLAVCELSSLSAPGAFAAVLLLPALAVAYATQNELGVSSTTRW